MSHDLLGDEWPFYMGHPRLISAYLMFTLRFLRIAKLVATKTVLWLGVGGHRIVKNRIKGAEALGKLRSTALAPPNTTCGRVNTVTGGGNSCYLK